VKLPIVRIEGWSVSKLSSWEECPLRTQLYYAQSLCPICFKGKVMGGFDSPKVCDTCGKTIEDKFKHGNETGKALEEYVNGSSKKFPSVIRNETVRALARKLREAHKNGKAVAEYSITLDNEWRPISKFTKNAYFRARFDVIQYLPQKVIAIFDWKAYGINKRSGEIYVKSKYQDQLSIYCMAALSNRPDKLIARAGLVFYDAGPRFDPIVMRSAGDVLREDLKDMQRYWAGKAAAMLADDVFAPRPGDPYCGYCDYSKEKGGPCPVA